MSLLTEADKARELHLEIEEHVKSQGFFDLHLAEKLWKIKKKNLYKKAVGEGINTWIDYLRQPEVNITPYKANKLVGIYEHFVVFLQMPLDSILAYPIYALDWIAKKGAVGDDYIIPILEDSKVLSEKDWKDRYHEEIEQTEKTYVYLVMRKCVETGKMEKVHGIDSKVIEELIT